MRESLASAINSSHLEEKEWETSIDKIKALGYTAKEYAIGIDAIHLIDSLQPQAYKQIIYLLARKANAKFSIKAPRSMTIKICNQVIKETAFPQCRTCDGRGEARNDEQVITCPSCQGSRMHRHSDIERAQALQIPLEAYSKHWARRFQIVQGIFTTEMRESIINIRILLDRG
jgi:hypothetical protein